LNRRPPRQDDPPEVEIDQCWLCPPTRDEPFHLPFNTEIDALLKDYSTLYFDMSIANSVAPAETHEAELKRLIDTGFGDRIMFGSDTRPAAPILRRLENIAWLTEKQRRAILYDNAARFLRLDAQIIARHHAGTP
jgi:predicted TIM-barrel fold metal-dependent hydrolase